MLTKTNAHITSSTIGSSTQDVGIVDLDAESTGSVNAVVGAVAASVALSGSAGIGLAIGASLASNRIGYDTNDNADAAEVQAYISNSSVFASGALTLDAKSEQTIDAVVFAGAAAISGGSTVGVAASGAGVDADNKIRTLVKAFINGDGASGITAESVSIKADDSSSIDAIAAAASIAGSYGGTAGVSVSVGVSLAYNEISNEVKAYIQNANDQVETTGGDIIVTALSQGRVMDNIDLSSFTAGELDNAATAEEDDEDTSTDEAANDADDDAIILDDLREAFANGGETLSNIDTVTAPATFTAADGEVDLLEDDTVQLPTDYPTAKGQGGRVYRFKLDDDSDVDLATEDYTVGSRWELVEADIKLSQIVAGESWALRRRRRFNLHDQAGRRRTQGVQINDQCRFGCRVDWPLSGRHLRRWDQRCRGRSDERYLDQDARLHRRQQCCSERHG